MNVAETLPTKQKLLIGIGAAVAAGCHPCTVSYVAAAQAAGVCERGVRFAIESGLLGRKMAMAAGETLTNETFASPELDASYRAEKALLDAFIAVAAAIASNAAACLSSRVDAARALGATDDQLRVAAQIARGVKRGAESEAEAALINALGDATNAHVCAGRSSEATESGEPPKAASTSSGGGVAASGACGCGAKSEPEFETVRIEKTKSSCSLCEDYAREQSHKPIVVMSCEGACLRGEISRQAANHLCQSLAPEKTVRLCLGGAFTKDAGQRGLVRNAAKVIALEGCGIRCASRMMRGHFSELDAEVIVTDGLCAFDRALFGVDALPPDDVKELGRTVAAKVVTRL